MYVYYIKFIVKISRLRTLFLTHLRLAGKVCRFRVKLTFCAVMNFLWNKKLN